jgi:hypothetical protein
MTMKNNIFNNMYSGVIIRLTTDVQMMMMMLVWVGKNELVVVGHVASFSGIFSRQKCEARHISEAKKTNKKLN